MPFLTSDTECYTLRVGPNRLGGSGRDAIASEWSALAALPPAALVTVHVDGTSLIQRLAAVIVVKVNGDTLGAQPRELHDGAVIEVGKCQLTYAATRAGADAAAVTAMENTSGSGADQRTEILPAMAGGSARVVELASGRAFPIPAGGLAIGRDASCDIVVDGRDVSRRHATIHPDHHGFVVIDHSANGTVVNGTRAQKVQQLGSGDVLRIGGDDFRFDCSAPMATASSGSDGDPGVATVPQETQALDLGAVTTAASPPDPAASPRPRPAPPLAALEVTSGALSGTRFRIDRPVCAIGRGEENEVRLADETVSSAHATLLFKRGTWCVVDLRSVNGTFVDDSRIAGERALPDGCTLRVGNVKMTFRRLVESPASPKSTRRLAGLFGKLPRLF